MSNGYRDGAFAVGLIIGVASTLIIVVYGDAFYQLVKCISGSEDYCRYAAHEGEKEPEWWIWVRSLVKMEDTIAQWFMAFFTVVATGILLFTLNAANQTNKAAIQAARAALQANEIAKSEGRPWVVIDRELYCDFTDHGDWLRLYWRYDTVNFGRRPAYDVRIHSKVVTREELRVNHALIAEFFGECRKKLPRKAGNISFPGKGKTEGWQEISTRPSDHGGPDGPYTLFCLVVAASYRADLNRDERSVDGHVYWIRSDKRFIGHLPTSFSKTISPERLASATSATATILIIARTLGAFDT